MSETDTLASQGGISAEDVLKGAIIVGGIALGLLALKFLLEGESDED
jgi:hypothetical protein